MLPNEFDASHAAIELVDVVNGVGESYDLVFLSYDALAADGTLELVVGVQLVPETVGTATLVPEPGTAALLAAGLALVAGARGARGRR